MEELSLKKLIYKLPDYFQPERAAGVDVIVQVNLAGDKGGAWTVSIRDQTCKVVEGVHEMPVITIDAAAQNILDIIDGSLDPMVAYMTGKLTLKGDRSKAMKLLTLFKVDSLPF